MVLAQHANRPQAFRPHPDAARIFGMAGAIALNIALFMLLLVPMTAPVVVAPPDDVPYRWVMPEKKAPIPDKPEKAEVVKPQPTNTQTTKPEIVKPIVDPIIVDQGTLPTDPPIVTPTETFANTGPIDIAPPTDPVSGVRLEYADAPAPRYPIDALKEGLQGVVMLEVLVDIDGRPLEVNVHKSSGHRALDDAAKRHVLKKWTFRPAIKNGHAVQAIGIVPIDFTLNR